MVSYLLFLSDVLLVTLPGICCWTVLFPDDSIEERIAWGGVLGLGAAVYIAYICAFAQLSWFYPAWAAVLILSVGSFVRRGRLGSGDENGRIGYPNAALVLLLLIIIVVQTASVMRQIVPPGFDPAFHLLLAKKIALSGGIIRDWQPFENSTLNYPLGSHMLIVLFARFSGLPLPRVFQFLMVTFSVLSALAVYALGAEYFASETVGLYAAIAYSFWAFVGSADYLRWGGLPNQLGMLLGLGILGLVMRVGEERKRIVLMALLFASVCLTHHHVMFTMGFILIGLMVFFIATNDAQRRYRTIFYALAIGSAGASFFLVPYALKVVSLSKTNVFHMDDNWPVLGIVLVCFALDGLVLDYYRKSGRPYALHVVAAILVLLYLLFGWVYYYYRLHMQGEGFSAFTPSRFITDMVYFLSIFAGYSLYRLQKDRGWRGSTTIAIALMFGFVNYPLWHQVFTPDGEPGRFAAYEWIANHTPANSIVMTGDPWASYATWRRTLGTPRPVSEPRVPPRINEEESKVLLAGGSPKELQGIELLAIVRPGDRSQGKLLWSRPDGWGVREVDGARQSAHEIARKTR